MIGPGTTLLHYRIVEKIGEGGMGEVWKATDTTLGRLVAVKILPEAFARDADRRARFEREARLLAALNHPNIATVHGLHEAEGVYFLAMELAAGRDLSKRLASGPLPLDEALRIGLQVAEAMEAAHENGVIHRDLKPANVQVDEQGVVKVLDFGLAKALEGPQDGRDPSLSPTVTWEGTRAGVILGTAAYMSPEQAKGRPADKRADIWAFGAVLLEMLTGRTAFRSGSVAETLAAVIKEEPRWDTLPPETPPRIRRLLERCLEKEPRQRLRDAGEARIAISRTIAGDASDGAERTASPVLPVSRRMPLPWALVGLLLALLAATWLLRGDGPSPAGTGAEAARLSIVLPEAEPMFLASTDLEVMTAFALDPAGGRVVYAARGEGPISWSGDRALRLRPLGAYRSEPVLGSEGAEQPFFSADGRWIGFFGGTKLVKIPAGGGARVTIAEGIGAGNGASWGADGKIVFAQSYFGPLWVVADTGGEPRALTTLAEGELSHRFPQILPDGRSVLFTIKPEGILSFDDAQLAVADLESGEHRVLVEHGTFARYAASGHLLYAREGKLLAAPFDLDRLTVSGGAVPVVDGLFTNPVTGSALMEVSEDGTLVYVSGGYRSGPTLLFSLDRETGGRRELAPDDYVSMPRLSPDGRRLALHGAAANDTVMVLELERGTVARMTEPSANNILPIWSYDGSSVIFASDRNGADELVTLPLDGGEMRTLVPNLGRQRQFATSWSPDGRLLALDVGPFSSRDIWVLDTGEDGGPAPFLESPYDEGEAFFSPDGRWIAYTSDESGDSQVYCRRYPGPGGKVQLTLDGGSSPRWRSDGRELYYLTRTQVMALPITWGPAPRPGVPTPVFESEESPPVNFDVDGEGRLFYIVALDLGKWQSARIDVVLNWFQELRRDVFD